MTTHLDPTRTQVNEQLQALRVAVPLGIFARLVAGTQTTNDLALLILRVSFGFALALTHGRAKLAAPTRFFEGLGKHGFPLPVLFGWAAILSEFAGGLLLAVGLLT